MIISTIKLSSIVGHCRESTIDKPLLIRYFRGMKNKLTTKQKMFVKEYVLGAEKGNATSALMKAGYQCKDREIAASVASTTLRKPHIKLEVERLLQKCGVDNEHLVGSLGSFIKGAVNNSDKSTPADGIRSIELLFRLQGMLSNDSNDKESLTIQLQGKSVSELQTMLKQIRDEGSSYLLPLPPTSNTNQVEEGQEAYVPHT